MANILTLIQSITAVLLVLAILLQQRGAGLGGAFGGSGTEVYSVKRGAEKTIFYITIFLSVIFIGSGIVRLIL